MSTQTDVLRELAELFNGRKPIDMARFFTEDFRLEDPGAGVVRNGLAGAQSMMEAVRALAHDGRLEILDMFEGGDRVAARWSYRGRDADFAMMSMYEFKGERIQRDWGILARAPWADSSRPQQQTPPRQCCLLPSRKRTAPSIGNTVTEADLLRLSVVDMGWQIALEGRPSRG